MSDTITILELWDGDVLLYRGTSFISKGIQFFDGTEVSHAALYLGNEQVGEAVGHGLLSRGVQESIAGAEWVQARRLKERPTDMGPVLARGLWYVEQGNRYGYEQILLLAFLCLTRKLKMTPTLRLLVRTVLDVAASLLTRLTSMGKQPMICSEYVYRAYDEALPEIDDPYSLRIPISAVEMMIGAPAGLGQGIHPQSLLALVASSPAEAWIRAPAPAVDLTAGAPAAVDESEIEGLVSTYLGEVKGDVSAWAAPADVTIEELRASVDRFAASLYAAHHEQPQDAIGSMAILGNRSPVHDYLVQVAADFVTPGDLLYTPSLFLLGTIEA